VLLIEAIGSMGGMGTNAFVSNWYSLNNGEELMIGGLILELIQKLYQANQVAPAAVQDIEKGRLLDAVGFNPEGSRFSSISSATKLVSRCDTSPTSSTST